MTDVSVTDVSKLTSLWVWYLADPQAPRRVGTVSLIAATKRVSFTYDAAWKDGGFSLSPTMKLGRRGAQERPILPPAGGLAPGALDDSMPDRWGQSTIRAIDRPKRLATLDFLYYAGDRRFGALGVSSDPEVYRPCPESPLLSTASLEEAHALIQRIIDKQPLNERERRMLQSSRSLGGAQPKMLVSIDGEEWIAKFPKGDNVDHQLIEHASMTLAREIGIRAVESRVYPIATEHVVMTKRFDRRSARRVHALSAKTLLEREGTESYATMADVIREWCHPEEVAEQRRELFARMVYNILIDNTDDHTKNHAFLRRDDGYYELAPAYDIPPQMNGLGEQAIPVADGSGSDFGAALEHCARFGLTRDEAVETWREVADGVSRWKEVFRSVGVLGSDLDYLSDYLDTEEMLGLRAAADRPGQTRTRAGSHGRDRAGR